MSTARRQIVEEKDYEEENAPCLHISRALTLRHPGGFEVLQGAYAMD